MTERRLPKTIQQVCPNCSKTVAAVLEYTYDACNIMTSDRSACPDCGLLLWEWKQGEKIKFASRFPDRKI